MYYDFTSVSAQRIRAKNVEEFFDTISIFSFQSPRGLWLSETEEQRGH